ncbi:glycerate kinase-like [Penaeus monodon]|uniref:glycerate kinase-like n=1 Tax=Penaeus monodon TaxID=6687 RepID=UPI0018A7DE56|nr:glycerate kinase-like [Penaeus monodon]
MPIMGKIMAVLLCLSWPCLSMALPSPLFPPALPLGRDEASPLKNPFLLDLPVLVVSPGANEALSPQAVGAPAFANVQGQQHQEEISRLPLNDAGSGTVQNAFSETPLSPQATAKVCHHESETLQSAAVAAYREGVAAVTGPLLFRNHVSRIGDDLIVGNKRFPLRNNVYVVGFGKAVLSMVGPLEELLGSHLQKGIVSVPVGIQQDLRGPRVLPSPHSRVQVFEGAAGNIPDETAEETTKKIMRLVAGLTPDDFLVVLISGGGSSLLPAPIPPLSLAEKGHLVRALGRAGATINELNTVRRAISLVKGGGLAQMSAAPLLSLILSDVVGDPLEVIASGPTVPNPDVPDAAIQVLRQCNMSLPQPVEDAIRTKNVAGSDFSHVSNFLLGSNKLSIEAASHRLRHLGFVPVAVSSTVTGDAVQLGRHLAHLAAFIASHLAGRPAMPVDTNYWAETAGTSSSDWRELSSAIVRARFGGGAVAVVTGGEPTSTVRGSGGRGGRNQEVALAAGVELEEVMAGQTGEVLVLSGATDGIDGPTPVAGAAAFWRSLSTGGHRSTITEGVEQGLSPAESLAKSDSYTFFRNLSGGRYHLLQGHTGTNVMDLHILLVKA